MGVEFKFRSTMLGTFKMPATAELCVERWSTNGLYFAANYAAILLCALVLATLGVGRWAVVLAILAVFAHATLKTRNIKSKMNAFRYRHSK